MKGHQRPTSVALANNHHEYTSPGKYSSSSRKHPARSMDDDDDWVLETPKRRPPRTVSSSERKGIQNTASVESNMNRIIQSVAEETTPTRPLLQKPVATTPTKTSITPPNIVVNKIQKTPVTSSESKLAAVAIKRESEKKKHLQVKIVLLACQSK